VIAAAAAALAACALVQLASPGAKYVLPALPAVLDGLVPRSGSGPAAVRVGLGLSQVAAVAHLPLAAGFAAAHAAAPSWEAAVDNLFTGLTTAMSRVGLVCGAGLLDDGATYSPVQMLLDCETFTNTAAVGAGIVVDDETIAMDVILSAGECGNALGHKHTRRHMREVWRPRLFDRTPHEAWAREGRRDATDRARDLAAELLASHEVTPLEAETSATLRRIIEKAGL
jgi:trimethylamine---corrinoid protein Co-methyltransferase